LAKTRTSTFAAALRKLAKQTSDSLIATDSGSAPHSIPYGLSVAHSSNLSKNSNNSSFQSPYQSSAIRQSPPIVTIAPIPAHQIDRSESDNQLRNHLRKSDNQSYYEHRIHTDPKESLIYSHSQRTSPIVQVRPSPSHVHNDSLNSVGNHSILQNNVTNRMPGFQPYRSGLEDSLRSNSSTSLASAPLPSHLLPYDAMAFPYHPFLPHTNPNPLPHHAPHPSASYRMGDPYYMDRFGLLRGQLHVPSAPLPMAGSGTTSSVPFNLVRYSELLNSQTERLINDERQRLLNQTLTQSAQTSYKPNTQTIDSPPIHMTNNNEKYGNNSEHFLMNHSMKNHSTSGSILSGTPRDVTPLSGSFGNGIRKPNGPNVSTNRPLNLSSDNEQHILEQKYLWRPQSDGQTDHNSFNQSHRLMESNIHLQNKDSVLAEDVMHNKNYRINSFHSNSDRSTDKLIITADKQSSERNNTEGLHSRILENSEKNSSNQSIHQSTQEVVSNKKADNCSINENEVRVVSKLDLEELKLKHKREIKFFENGFSSDSDEESEDSDDSEDNRFKYNIILTKRLPLELDTNEEKMQFL
ncbi:unnamed protein product, partial [Medioppia subpectinata]